MVDVPTTMVDRVRRCFHDVSLSRDRKIPWLCPVPGRRNATLEWALRLLRSTPAKSPGPPFALAF